MDENSGSGATRPAALRTLDARAAEMKHPSQAHRLAQERGARHHADRHVGRGQRGQAELQAQRRAHGPGGGEAILSEGPCLALQRAATPGVLFQPRSVAVPRGTGCLNSAVQKSLAAGLCP